MLEPFGIKKYCTDDWDAYERNLPEEEHEIGEMKLVLSDKKQTQQIERKYLELRTRIKRLARRTICFSKPAKMVSVNRQTEPDSFYTGIFDVLTEYDQNLS